MLYNWQGTELSYVRVATNKGTPLWLASTWNYRTAWNSSQMYIRVSFLPRHNTRFFFCGSYKAIATFARVYTALSACYSSPSLFYFLHREGNADQEVCSKQNFFCICVSNVVWHCTYDMAGLYRVYMQVFPDKARRREVRFIEVHCDDARCSWTGNAGELEVPIFFSRVTSDHHDTLRG